MRILIGLGLACPIVMVVLACGSSDSASDSHVNGGAGDTSATDCVGSPQCAAPACGAMPVPVCVNGQWACTRTGPVHVPCGEDGGVDAARNNDASSQGRDAATPGATTARVDAGDAVIPCGSTSCTRATQYCRIGRTGVGTSGATISTMKYECPPLPTQCGATPTCACIAQADRDGCTCGGYDGGISSECVYPPPK